MPDTDHHICETDVAALALPHQGGASERDTTTTNYEDRSVFAIEERPTGGTKHPWRIGHFVAAEAAAAAHLETLYFVSVRRALCGVVHTSGEGRLSGAREDGCAHRHVSSLPTL